MGNVAKSDGPMVGAYLIFGNNVTNDTFPHISIVGSGMPGNQGVHLAGEPAPELHGLAPGVALTGSAVSADKSLCRPPRCDVSSLPGLPSGAS